MKTLIINFVVAMMILAHAMFTGYPSTADKLETANHQIVNEKQDLKEAQQVAPASKVKVTNQGEWNAFKTDAEAKIKDNQIRIDELKVKINNQDKTFDDMNAMNVMRLEQKNTDLKARIDAYEAKKRDWESYKREFNHDMDELGQALRDLTVNNKN